MKEFFQTSFLRGVSFVCLYTIAAYYPERESLSKTYACWGA